MKFSENLRAAFDRTCESVKHTYGDAKTGTRNYIDAWKKHVAEVREAQERFQKGMENHCEMFGLDETEDVFEDVMDGKKTLGEVEDKVRREKESRAAKARRPSNPFG